MSRRLLEGSGCGDESLKKPKTPHGFPVVFSVSWRCRVLEGSGCEDQVPKTKGCHGGPGGIRASDCGVPSLNCLVARSLDPLKIQNPKSKIRNPKSKLPSKIQTVLARFWGFWILDRYVAILFVRPPVAQFWNLDFGFWILGHYVAILFVQILDFGFWILVHVLDPT